MNPHWAWLNFFICYDVPGAMPTMVLTFTLVVAALGEGTYRVAVTPL